MAHCKLIWKILDWKTKMNENLQHVQWVLSSPDMKGVWSFKRLGSAGRCLLSFWTYFWISSLKIWSMLQILDLWSSRCVLNFSKAFWMNIWLTWQRLGQMSQRNLTQRMCFKCLKRSGSPGKGIGKAWGIWADQRASLVDVSPHLEILKQKILNILLKDYQHKS